MGCVPQAVVPDNLKAAVVRASRYEPTLNETYAHLLNHYGTHGLPARVRRPRDNAMCESFFATLQCELIDRRSFRTQGEARCEVFGFIEGWYNPHRRHSSLGYESPVRFEARAREAAA